MISHLNASSSMKIHNMSDSTYSVVPVSTTTSSHSTSRVYYRTHSSRLYPRSSTHNSSTMSTDCSCSTIHPLPGFESQSEEGGDKPSAGADQRIIIINRNCVNSCSFMRFPSRHLRSLCKCKHSGKKQHHLWRHPYLRLSLRHPISITTW